MGLEQIGRQRGIDVHERGVVSIDDHCHDPGAAPGGTGEFRCPFNRNIAWAALKEHKTQKIGAGIKGGLDCFGR